MSDSMNLPSTATRDHAEAVVVINPTDGKPAVPGAPSADQDPIYDHANGQRVTVTQAVQNLTALPSGTKYIRVSANGVRVALRTDGTAISAGSPSSTELSKCVFVEANTPEIHPVPGAVSVSVYAETGSGTITIVPLKSR